MRTRPITALLTTLVAGSALFAACGSDDATSDPPEAAGDTAEGAAGDDTTGADDADGSDGAADDAGDEASSEEADENAAGADDGDSDGSAGDSGGGSGAGSGGGTATLTLANGASFEFSVLCTLEPQMAAGSEILFTATSYDDPGLDITQFGDEGAVTGIASVSVFDGSSFESLWGASSFYEAFGGSLELTLDGSTIRGVGRFYEMDDPVAGGEAVDGEVVANC